MDIRKVKKLIELLNESGVAEIEITEGVFKNCVAIFKCFKSDERVILLMNLMGQQQTISVKKKSLIGL